MLPDLITVKTPPPKRVAKAEGGVEWHFTEAAVMLAYAVHLFEVDSSLKVVEVHPDGEHGKQFDIRSWLEKRGFELLRPEGSTNYGGEYSDGTRTIYVSLRSGLGDVVAKSNDHTILAECKGGIINSKHAGQKSRLRRGLCEAVGLLMSRPLGSLKQFAVVPATPDAEALAAKLSERCKLVGIGICLIDAEGGVREIGV
ncbi:MAG: hypothetical protein U5O39_20015 [Gammaproteobacteria bacterium]|nr:hypothetical protein [Gammaproteobacteria bacterium]